MKVRWKKSDSAAARLLLLGHEIEVPASAAGRTETIATASSRDIRRDRFRDRLPLEREELVHA